MTMHLIYQPTNYSIDHQVLQKDLDTLTSWDETWKIHMQLNVNKCSILQLSKYHSKVFSLTGKPLKTVE